MMPHCAAAVALLPLLLLPPAAFAANMNGKPGQYKIANPNTLSGNQYSTDYDAEYFEVLSPPIRSRYSEVVWRMLDPVPLPDNIRERFEGKIMAVVGYEADQVRVAPDGKHVPVPITHAYNHHYGAWLLNSRKVKLVKAKVAEDDTTRLGMNHGSDEYWTAQMLSGRDEDEDEEEGPDPQASDVPLTTFFSEANGGEFRLSYHGYPRGHAQLVDSPDAFQVQPMQIDTWNREMDDDKFKPGPLPKSSLIPPSAGYNGLLECPCSDRLEKKWEMTYKVIQGSDSPCEVKEAVGNSSECFLGARNVVAARDYMERTTSNSSRPVGCILEQHADGSTDVVWNSASAQTPPSETLGVSGNKEMALVAYSSSQVNTTVYLAENDGPDAVTITIVGPADHWFGVGFGSDSMCLHMAADECTGGGPYAIIVGGDEQNGVTERKLDFHGQGQILPSSLSIKSDSTQDGNRTVVLLRSLKGASDKHYSFDSSVDSLPIITARGCGPTFAQHCGHGPSKLNFLPLETPSSVCQAGIEGTIGGNKFNNHRCAKFPQSDLDAQQNPTCRVETYRGGLSCCRDGMSLLDKDQVIPWPDEYLEYRMKFRFYFEEYQPPKQDKAPPSHHELVRLYWQTEAHAGEYDITKCPKGTPPDQCVQIISSRWKVADMMRECPLRPDDSLCTGKSSSNSTLVNGVKLIYAGPHCHAPTCLSMDLYNADTGQLMCHVEPIHGQGKEGIYDEHGFLAIPPCLWGDPADGLLEPELLPLNATLLSIKRNNNTLGHTGEMASWQMRGVIVKKQGQELDLSLSKNYEFSKKFNYLRYNQPQSMKDD